MYEEKHREGGAAGRVGEGGQNGGVAEAQYTRPRRIRLIRGLPRKRLFQMIHHHLRRGDVSRRALAFYLLDLHERREYQAVSCASTIEYAVGTLGLSSREARGLLRAAKALEELPELDRAFAAGEIGWSKLPEITLVAIPETEIEWLAFAREHSCREVESAVKRSRRGQNPPGPDDLGTPRVTFRIQYDLPMALNTLWQTAVEKLMGELGEESTPAEAL